MPLPEQDYYALYELNQRWGISQKLICHFIETGKLPCCVWLKQSLMEVGRMKKRQNGQEFFTKEKEQWIKGFVHLLSDDCRVIFRHGNVDTCLFRSILEPEHFLQLKEEPNTASFESRDLVVLCQEVKYFENRYQLTKTLPIRSSLETLSFAIESSSFIHSDDYQTILIHGKRFRFGMIQAAIIRQLHEASKTNQPWVHGKILLDKAGSQCQQLKNIFKAKAGWRECIESDGRGYYRLNL
jgi:hypothetical protein